MGMGGTNRKGSSAKRKYHLTLGLPVGAVINCADNSGAKKLYIFSVFNCGARLNRLPRCGPGDMVMASVRRGKTGHTESKISKDTKKDSKSTKVTRAIIIRQRKPFRRVEGNFVQFEDNAGVVVNQLGEPKGTAISGPVAKECADLWSRLVERAHTIL